MRGIGLSVLPTVVYRGKICCCHLLPELLEARGIVALCPCSSEEKLPQAVQVYQCARLVLAYRLVEILPQRPHAPPLLHKRLQIDPTQERREWFEQRHRHWRVWQMQDFKIQALHSRTPIVNAMLRSKYRLIDELVHIPGGQGCMRLVVCRQDRTELRARHAISPYAGSASSAPTAMPRSTMCRRTGSN